MQAIVTRSAPSPRYRSVHDDDVITKRLFDYNPTDVSQPKGIVIGVAEQKAAQQALADTAACLRGLAQNLVELDEASRFDLRFLEQG
jgi:hypothetical protein